MKTKVYITIAALILMAVFNDEAVSAFLFCALLPTWCGKLIWEGLKHG